MKIKFIFSAFIFILLAFFSGCSKEGNSSALASQQQLIANAKYFFEKEVAPVTLQPQQGISGGTQKTPVWERAREVNLTTGPAVVVPLHYAKRITVSPSFTGGQSFILSAVSQLLIYTGKDKHSHAVVITGLPYNLPTTNSQSFSGFIVVEDWAGNTMKDYKLSEGKVYTRVKSGSPSSLAVSKEVEGKKTVTTIIETCYYFTTCAGTVDNPYMSCSTQDLGCDYEYIGEDQDMLDDGTGGGGGLDAGGIIYYTDPNTFSGSQRTTNPDLRVDTSCFTCRKAITADSGLFLLANVYVAWSFDPLTQSLIAGSVQTHLTGTFAGTWAQTAVSGIVISNGQINFVIEATITSNVGGLTTATDYEIFVQYTIATNTCVFTNYKL